MDLQRPYVNATGIYAIVRLSRVQQKYPAYEQNPAFRPLQPVDHLNNAPRVKVPLRRGDARYRHQLTRHFGG